MKAHWQTEKDAIGGIREHKGAIGSLRGEAERFERAGELAKASRSDTATMTEFRVV